MYDTYEQEQMKRVTGCQCGHDEKSHQDSFKPTDHKTAIMSCFCCASLSKEFTIKTPNRPLVLFRYIGAQRGHFSGVSR